MLPACAHSCLPYRTLLGKTLLAKGTTYVSYENGEIKLAQIWKNHLYHLTVIMVKVLMPLFEMKTNQQSHRDVNM